MAYPISVGSNEVSNYTGILDVGVQARFIELGLVQLGVSANIDYLRNSSTVLPPTSFDQLDPIVQEPLAAKITETGLFIQPRVFAELNLTARKLKPFVGLGYSFTNFKSKNSASGEKSTGNSGGLNTNIGLAYYFSDAWFAHAQYDYIRRNQESIFADTDYVNNISLIKIGLGYRF